MKILITGAAGFIASHVCDRYVGLGHEVTVLDDLSTGFERNLNPKARFVKEDLRNLDAVAALVRDGGFEVVNHHAAQMDVRRSLQEPIYDAQVNILGSLNLIHAAAHAGVRKFIYISTGGAVYGEPKSLPVTETDSVMPECHYGISKHTPEHYLHLYRLLKGLDYTVLRYPNVYGPRQNPHGEAGVIAIFSSLMLAGKTPILYGEGAPERDYVFIGDVAEANVLALDRGSGEIVNLGSERGTSVRELADRLKAITGYAGGYDLQPLRPGEIHRIFLSGRKARAELGWAPRTTLDEGLRQTVDWIRGRAA